MPKNASILWRIQNFFSISYDRFLDWFRIIYAQVPDCLYSANFALPCLRRLESSNHK